ncbi:MAG: nitrogen fixation protein FixA, partial [Alphaproteobacteria bacterium]
VQELKTKTPCLITMLEGTCDIRRGSMADALKAARADIVRWSAADAGIEDLLKCGLRGSPTVVKRVFAPQANTEKAEQIDVGTKTADEIADALIGTIFTRQPALEDEMKKTVSAY